MTKPIDRDSLYRKRAFDAAIIELCVRWYISYRLSYRDLVEMMAERGVKVAHSTILRWVTRYVPEYEKRWNRFSRTVGTSWRVDETYIPIKAKGHFVAGEIITGRSIAASMLIVVSVFLLLSGPSKIKRSGMLKTAAEALR
jgi:hypothetical protein